MSLDSPPSRCDLCRDPLGSSSALRCAELDLCPSCFDGSNIDQSLRASRGFLLEHERGEQLTDRGLDEYYKAVGTLPMGTGVTVAFGREDLAHKVTKLFRRELQVGDPLFDDHVFVDAMVTPRLESLMATAGFQSAVMDLLSEVRAFRIEDRVVRVEVYSRVGLSPIGTLGRSVVVLMHHLDTFARSSRPGEDAGT